MWIAKPLDALNREERTAWCNTLRVRAQRGGDGAPLSQTLSWARAIQGAALSAYLVFSPDELTGGVVFASPLRGGLRFECINGPLLDWDEPQKSVRQLATFATAVSRLDSRFVSLMISPRWQEGTLAKRLLSLPLDAQADSRAATLVLPLDRSPQEVEKSFNSRLRRTLAKCDRSKVRAEWRPVSQENLRGFHDKMVIFAHRKGFAVPPISWFEGLLSPESPDDPATEVPEFWFASAWDEITGAQAQLMIAFHAREAHYLFGFENRPAGGRSGVSPAAAAHRLAIRQSIEAGMVCYDFNGYVEHPEVGNPYAGVCEFKAQFGGKIHRYEIPHFEIQS